MISKWILATVAFVVVSPSSWASFEEIEKVLSENPDLKSVDEFIRVLPEGMKSRWAAVFESHGRQKKIVSPTRPRVVLYGEGNLVFTFSGCQGDEGPYPICEEIEALDYNKEKNQFEFRSFGFPGKSGSGRVLPSEVNSKTCLSCHGGEPRPIWEGYNFWPGIYGSVTARDGKSERISVPSKEYDHYRSFLESHWDESGKPLADSRYGNLKMRWSDWVSDKQAKAQKYMPVIHGLDAAPNQVLGSQLAHDNNLRMIRALLETDQFENHQYLLAWWSNKKCFNPILEHSYLHDHWYANWPIDSGFESSYLDLQGYALLREELEAEFRINLKGAYAAHDASSTDSTAQRLTVHDMIYYNQAVPVLARLAELTGHTIDEWSLSKMNRLNLATHEFGVARFQYMLHAGIEKEHPELFKKSCKELLQLSRERLR